MEAEGIRGAATIASRSRVQGHNRMTVAPRCNSVRLLSSLTVADKRARKVDNRSVADLSNTIRASTMAIAGITSTRL